MLCVSTANAESVSDRCVLKELKSADVSATVGDIRALFESRQVKPEWSDGVIEQRIAAEADALERAFVLTAHRPKYVLPYTYNGTPIEAAFQLVNSDQRSDSAETQFQVSFKSPLAQHLLNRRNDLFAGFTCRAWWQVYNDDLSSPFRETDEASLLNYNHRNNQFGLGIGLNDYLETRNSAP